MFKNISVFIFVLSVFFNATIANAFDFGDAMGEVLGTQDAIRNELGKSGGETNLIELDAPILLKTIDAKGKEVIIRGEDNSKRVILDKYAYTGFNRSIFEMTLKKSIFDVYISVNGIELADQNYSGDFPPNSAFSVTFKIRDQRSKDKIIQTIYEAYEFRLEKNYQDRGYDMTHKDLEIYFSSFNDAKKFRNDVLKLLD